MTEATKECSSGFDDVECAPLDSEVRQYCNNYIDHEILDPELGQYCSMCGDRLYSCGDKIKVCPHVQYHRSCALEIIIQNYQAQCTACNITIKPRMQLHGYGILTLFVWIVMVINFVSFIIITIDAIGPEIPDSDHKRYQISHNTERLAMVNAVMNFIYICMTILVDPPVDAYYHTIYSILSVCSQWYEGICLILFISWSLCYMLADIQQEITLPVTVYYISLAICFLCFLYRIIFRTPTWIKSLAYSSFFVKLEAKTV